MIRRSTSCVCWVRIESAILYIRPPFPKKEERKTQRKFDAERETKINNPSPRDSAPAIFLILNAVNQANLERDLYDVKLKIILVCTQRKISLIVIATVSRCEL